MKSLIVRRFLTNNDYIHFSHLGICVNVMNGWLSPRRVVVKRRWLEVNVVACLLYSISDEVLRHRRNEK